MYIHNIYIYIERERDTHINISSFCLRGPSGVSIFRILTFLKSYVCLWGLPFGGIHFENIDLKSSFCLRDFPSWALGEHVPGLRTTQSSYKTYSMKNTQW